MPVKGWKTLVCNIEVPCEGEHENCVVTCAKTFGRASALRDHQRKDHGKKFASDEEKQGALALAKQLVTDILQERNLISYMHALDEIKGTEKQGYMTKRLINFLEETAVKDLD